MRLRRVHQAEEDALRLPGTERSAAEGDPCPAPESPRSGTLRIQLVVEVAFAEPTQVPVGPVRSAALDWDRDSGHGVAISVCAYLRFM